MRTILRLISLCFALTTYGCEKQKALPGLFGIRFGQSIDKESKRVEIVNFGVGQRIEPSVKIPGLNSYVVFGRGEDGVSTIRAAGIFGTKEEAYNNEKRIIKWLEDNISGINFQIVPMKGMVEEAYAAYFKSPKDQNKIEQIIVVKHCVGNEVVVLANDLTIDALGLMFMLNDREMDVSLHEGPRYKSTSTLPNITSIQTNLNTYAKNEYLAQDIQHVNITNLSEWITIRQKEKLTFCIPPTMELRDNRYAKPAFEYSKSVGVPYNVKQITVQQKGLNAYEAEAGKHYVRIIYTCENGHKGDFCSKGYNLDNTTSGSYWRRRLLKLGQELKDDTIMVFRSNGAVAKILDWGEIKLVKFGEYIAIKTSYLRQFEANEPVYVEVYQVCDDSKLHTFLFSCKESESSIWLREWEKIKTTIQFM